MSETSRKQAAVASGGVWSLILGSLFFFYLLVVIPISSTDKEALRDVAAIRSEVIKVRSKQKRLESEVAALRKRVTVLAEENGRESNRDVERAQ